MGEKVVMVLMPSGHPGQGAEKAWNLAESPAGQEGNCEAAARARESETAEATVLRLQDLSSEVGGKESTRRAKGLRLCREQRAGPPPPAGRAAGRGWGTVHIIVKSWRGEGERRSQGLQIMQLSVDISKGSVY